MRLGKIPTGIKTFDVNINGGFPAGSVVLLLEDIGAGAREFIYTSIFNLNLIRSDAEKSDSMKKKHVPEDSMISNSMLPNKICYITVSKSKEDILNENAYAFHTDFYNVFKNDLVFKELSDVYFRHSIVQNIWISDEKQAMEFDESLDKNILEEISEFLTTHAKNNIVILDRSQYHQPGINAQRFSSYVEVGSPWQVFIGRTAQVALAAGHSASIAGQIVHQVGTPAAILPCSHVDVLEHLLQPLLKAPIATGKALLDSPQVYSVS